MTQNRFWVPKEGEVMVPMYDFLSKRESKEWRRYDESLPKSTKVIQSTKKVMSTIFSDCEGILLTEFEQRKTSANSTYLL